MPVSLIDVSVPGGDVLAILVRGHRAGPMRWRVYPRLGQHRFKTVHLGGMLV